MGNSSSVSFIFLGFLLTCLMGWWNLESSLARGIPTDPPEPMIVCISIIILCQDQIKAGYILPSVPNKMPWLVWKKWLPVKIHPVILISSQMKVLKIQFLRSGM
jgi:hypothetical protein